MNLKNPYSQQLFFLQIVPHPFDDLAGDIFGFTILDNLPKGGFLQSGNELKMDLNESFTTPDLKFNEQQKRFSCFTIK